MTGLSAQASPTELIPGSPGAIRSFAHELGVLAAGLGDAAEQLAAIEAGAWRGEAGDAFREILDKQPEQFRSGAASFAAARSACLAYAAAVERGQLAAARAVDTYAESARLSESWRRRMDTYAALQRRAAAGDAAAAGELACLPAPPPDPGQWPRAEAEVHLRAARAEVDDAAARAAAALDDAKRAAPRKPGILKRLGYWSSEFVKGMKEAVWEFADFAWTYSPTRLVLDPAGWTRDVKQLGKGLQYAATHPVEFAKAVADWETFQESPARWLGKLAPEVILALASGGSSQAAVGATRAQRTLGRSRAVAKKLKYDVDSARGSRVVPALEDLSERVDLHRAISGGDHPPGFAAGDGSPAALASARQGLRAGSQVDAWANTRLYAGDTVAVASPRGIAAATGDVTVPAVDAVRLGSSPQAWYAGTQTPPSVALAQISVFRINEQVDVAAARATANPAYGVGGAVTIFIPDLDALVQRGALGLVDERPLAVAFDATAVTAPSPRVTVSATGR